MDINLSEFFRLFWPLLVIQLFLDIIALGSLFKSDKPRYLPKWAWVLVILLISTFGAISYLIIGREREE